DEIGWSVFDHADGEVPVLHRSGELPFLERCAHGGVLAPRHAAAEDEGLGATAHRGVRGADDRVIGTRFGQLDGPDLPMSGSSEPERSGCVTHLIPSRGEPTGPRARDAEVERGVVTSTCTLVKGGPEQAAA